MIPKRIQPYFEIISQTKDGEHSLVEGILTCCNGHDFEILIAGKIENSICSKMYLLPQNNILALEARCKKCGKVISVFDSRCDGYDHCEEEKPAYIRTTHTECKKCLHGSFSIGIKYEYPDIHELEELEIAAIDNAFTWIWISVACNRCGSKYKNFVDYDTT